MVPFLKHYKPFSRDKLGKPYTLMYQLGDAIRFRSGKGRRALEGYPNTANLSIDPSAIERFCSDPTDYPKTMSDPYRPCELVKIASAHANNAKAWVESYGLDPEKYPFPADI